MSPAEFLNVIVVDILKTDLSAKKIERHGGSKNTLWQCAYRNTKIGHRVIDILTSLIKSEIRFDKSKKNEIFDFLEQFLTDGEKKYVKDNPEDIKSLIRFASLKINRKMENNEGLMKDSVFILNGKQYKIVDIPKLLEMGWTIRDYVVKSTMLSYEIYDELTDEHVTELEKSIKVVSEQPENRRILLDEKNEMIGMWSFKPFYDDVFEKAKSGELFDGEITPDMMPSLIPGEVYNIYFSNIVLKEKYRRGKVFGFLFNSVWQLIEEWAKDDIFINEICAQAYSDSGKNLCRTTGLKFIKKHVDHGDIYCGYVYDIVEKRFCNKLPELRNLYREFKKENYADLN